MKWVWLHAGAVDDIEWARRWYETQRLGLGDEFAAALDGAFLLISDFPDGFPIVHRNTHRYLLERFPYCIYYRADPEGVLVVACLHAALRRRDTAVALGADVSRDTPSRGRPLRR